MPAPTTSTNLLPRLGEWVHIKEDLTTKQVNSLQVGLYCHTSYT